MPIAKFAVNRRVAVSMIALAIVVLGIFAIPRLPIALLPNFTQPVVTVSVNYPNVGPEQMETLITRPIENAVSRVNGIQQINSSSAEGVSTITAQFFFGTNIDTAAVDVQEQVDRIWGNLPNDPTLQRPVITKFDSNSLPVVRLFVTDPNMSLRDLGDLYTNTLGDEFSAIDGVAAVTVSNDQQRAIMVEPNAFALAANGITLPQISQRIAAENINLPAGIVQVGPNEYQVRSSALFTSAAQVGQHRRDHEERDADPPERRRAGHRFDQRATHVPAPQRRAGRRRRSSTRSRTRTSWQPRAASTRRSPSSNSATQA